MLGFAELFSKAILQHSQKVFLTRTSHFRQVPLRAQKIQTSSE